MSEIDQLIQQGQRLIAEPMLTAEEAHDYSDYEIMVVVKTTDSVDWNLLDDENWEPMFEAVQAKYQAIQRTLSETIDHLKGSNNPESKDGVAREFFWHIFPSTQWHIDWWSSALKKTALEPPNPSSSDRYIAANSLIDTARAVFYKLSLPNGGQTWLLNSLQCLEESPKKSYIPDTELGAISLDHAYFAAARAFTLRDIEGSYSEESRRCFEECFRAYFSVHLEIGAKSALDNPDLEEARRIVSFCALYKKAYHDKDEVARSAIEEYFSGGGSIFSKNDLQTLVEPYLSKIEAACSHVVLQAMVALHLFKIRCLDHEWENALRMYTHALACFDTVTREPDFGEDAFRKRNWRQEFGYKMWDEWDRYGHRLHEEALEAFAQLRKRAGGDIDWQEVYKHIQMILKAMESDLLDPELNYIPHWREARGWVEGSKLEPGELKDELRKEEDEKAEQRLKRYFFTNQQWLTLSERAKGRLVVADKLWFSHQHRNADAALSPLQEATEDLLSDLFGCETVVGFENMLRLKDPKVGFSTSDFTVAERDFVNRELLSHLKRLTDVRNKAVHAAGKPVVEREDEVALLFDAFMGIGCEGVLPRLANLKLKLFPIKLATKR